MAQQLEENDHFCHLISLKKAFLMSVRVRFGAREGISSQSAAGVLDASPRPVPLVHVRNRVASTLPLDVLLIDPDSHLDPRSIPELASGYTTQSVHLDDHVRHLDLAGQGDADPAPRRPAAGHSRR